jgi:hypothetical protein
VHQLFFLTKFSSLLSGPYSNYDALVCGTQPDAFDQYTIYGSAWLPGTTQGDVINGGLPFNDIFDSPPANGEAYTGNEILYYSEAIRSQYTYDTMEHLFYDVCKEGNLRQPENCVACVEACDGRGRLFPVCTVKHKNDGSVVFKSLCAGLDDIQFHRFEFYGKTNSIPHS